jgi:hypothetical protein
MVYLTPVVQVDLNKREKMVPNLSYKLSHFITINANLGDNLIETGSD